MGVDSPLAVLSAKHQPLFNYFKQLFAQVTNPPIDAIREEIVTSTTVYVGEEGNILEERPENCKILKVENPILTETDLLKIKYMRKPGFKVEEVPITYYKNTSLERAIDRLFTRTGPISSSCLTGILMRTMCPSRPFLRYRPSSSTW